MKTPIIFAISSVSLALISCGGGGGGGGGGSKATPEAYSSQGIPVIQRDKANLPYGYNDSYKRGYHDEVWEPPAEFRPDDFVTTKSYSVDLADGRKLEVFNHWIGDDFREIVILDGKRVAKLSDAIAALSYWNNYTSVDNTGDTFNHGISFSYFDKSNKPHSMYMYDHQKLAGTSVAPHGDAKWSWSDIEYGYTAISASHPDGHVARSFASDGTITVQGDKWNADLGPVTLAGNIDGTDVRGDATGNFFGRDLQGEFAGTDGIITNRDGEKMDFTFGGFAGGDADANFAGGWSDGKKN